MENLKHLTTEDLTAILHDQMRELFDCSMTAYVKGFPTQAMVYFQRLSGLFTLYQSIVEHEQMAEDNFLHSQES